MNNAEDSAAPQENGRAQLPMTPNGPDQTGGNLDKVRDILFGSQMRDLEKRFLRLEERVHKESAELRDEMRRRHEALDAYLRKEIDALSERLKGERDERTEALAEGTRAWKETQATLQKKIGQLDEQQSRAQRELRQQVVEQGNHLSDEIRQRNQDLVALLDRHLSELRGDKADRRTLAALFTEMAMRLSETQPATDE